jgi:probable rRNA maturation factor
MLLADVVADPADPDDSRFDMRPSDEQVIEVVAARGIESAIDLAWLRERVASIVPMLSVAIARLVVAIVPDAEMTRLHRGHCGIDSTTDVLTFHQHAAGAPIDVDIAVCVDEARRQAIGRGHSVERELLLYIVHGLLHCADYDDHDEAGYRAMHAEEDRILTAIGVGPTFLEQRKPGEAGAR